MADTTTREWTVEVERAQGDRRASGTARAVGSAEPSEGSPALRLAAARAWLAIGTQSTAAADWDAALAAARAGITELGDDYRPRGVKDDTGLRLHLVDDQLARGQTDAAARTALGVLDTRATLYARHHDLR